SKTRPNSSLGMSHPRPLHSPVIILPGTFGSIFDYTDIEQPGPACTTPTITASRLIIIDS
ncbi:MAG: hypothetical protein WAN49_21920, partial [Pseudolabrys sp.]